VFYFLFKKSSSTSSCLFLATEYLLFALVNCHTLSYVWVTFHLPLSLFCIIYKSSFLFLAGLGLEFRATCLLSRWSTIESCLQSYKSSFNMKFYARVISFGAPTSFSSSPLFLCMFINLPLLNSSRCIAGISQE
jgi:hypothetical protein